MWHDEDLIAALVVLLGFGLALGLPAIVRAWRTSRRPDSFMPDRSANDPER